MSFSASDLHNVVDGLLDELGYKIAGDDGQGWTWRFGTGDTPAVDGGLRFDHGAEASAKALSDLVGCVDDLLGTGRTVVERWETGDLAEAVRSLDGALRMLTPRGAAAMRGEDMRGKDARQRRIERLRRLIREGLTIDDCVELFGERSANNDEVLVAALAGSAEHLVVRDYTVVRSDLGEPQARHALVWLPLG